MNNRIKKVVGREILNARGKPTVEVKIITESGICAVASVPSGTSRGKYEAHEIYDNEKRYRGFGVRNAVNNINTIINDALSGIEVTRQREIDEIMIVLDGTKNKEKLGGNAILAVSVAVAKAGGIASSIPLYQYLYPSEKKSLPNIIATVIAGGEFSTSGLEFEDYLYILEGFDSFSDSIEALSDLRYLLEKKLRKKYGNFPEDGGALAPPLTSSREAFEIMMDIAKEVGCEKQVTLGLDVAASELFDKAMKQYKISNAYMTTEQLKEYYKMLCREYPLTFIEDPFDEDDFESFAKLKKALPGVQIVGDDLFATNVERLKIGIEKDSANTLLLKMNQIGTVSETIDACIMAGENAYDVAVSLRSGETTDDFIADLAVAMNTRQIKLGSPVRAERNTKYNRLLKIESELK